jgi:hypothetical protein
VNVSPEENEILTQQTVLIFPYGLVVSSSNFFDSHQPVLISPDVLALSSSIFFDAHRRTFAKAQ